VQKKNNPFSFGTTTAAGAAAACSLAFVRSIILLPRLETGTCVLIAIVVFTSHLYLLAHMVTED